MKAIQFSGGLDSLAMLFKLRPQWEDMHVFWCNTGAAYESVRDYMERIRTLVPHFHEVRSDQPQMIELYGWPVDVVPVSYTLVGQLVTTPKKRTFQSYMDCCHRAIWAPLNDAMRAYRVTDVFRGQRREEARRSPIPDGYRENGITYHFPLETWTRAQVIQYCEDHCAELIPSYYKEGEKTSRDCWNCTGYRDDNVERVKALPERQRKVVESVLHDWRNAIFGEMNAGA